MTIEPKDTEEYAASGEAAADNAAEETHEKAQDQTEEEEAAGEDTEPADEDGADERISVYDFQGVTIFGRGITLMSQKHIMTAEEALHHAAYLVAVAEDLPAAPETTFEEMLAVARGNG